MLHTELRDTPDDLTLENWLEPAFTGRAFHQLDSIVATLPVARGHGPVRALTEASHDGAIRAELESDRIRELVASNCTDSIVVLKGDTVMLEYLSPQAVDARHIVFSVSKSICGMLAGTLVQDGLLDKSALTSFYVPELSGSAYGSATVAQLLDMTASLQFDMDYTSPGSDVQTEDRATGWRPRRPGDPASTREFLAQLAPRSAHGEQFQYCSATTDALAWVLERASGVGYRQLLEQRIWSRMGAQDDAYLCVDSEQTPYACAGLGMTVRDLARFGRLILADGVFDGNQVVPAGWIADTRDLGHTGVGLPADLAAMHPQGSYRHQWYNTGDAQGTFYARGIFGQYLWINPAADVVIARFSSQPGPRDHLASQLAVFNTLSDLIAAPDREKSH